MHRLKVKILFLVLSFSLIGQAQQKWSLEDCVQYALEHNIQLKQQALNTQVQANRLQQSKIDLAPSLNASLSRNFSFGRRVDPYTNQFTEKTITSDNFSINSQLTLFGGWQKINTIKKNQLDLKADLAALDKLKNDISLNIASVYLNVLFNMELTEATRQQTEMTRLQVLRTQKLVEAGSLAKGSLLEIKAQLSNEELQTVNYENRLEISLLNLKQMLDLDTLGDFQILRPKISLEDVHLPLNADEVYEYAKQNMPQLLASQYRLESLKKSVAIAKGARSPRLNLGFGFGTGYSEARKVFEVESVRFMPNGGYALDGGTQYLTYSPVPEGNFKTKSFTDQIKDNKNTYAVLSLNIPIFNQWAVNSNIANQRIAVQNARYSIEYEEKKLYKEIQQKYLDALAAQKKLLAIESSLESAREAYDYAKKKFDVGMVNTLDFSLAKNRLMKTESDLLQAKYEFLFAVKILEFYQGKTIRL